MRILPPVILVALGIGAFVGYRVLAQAKTTDAPSGGSGQVEATTVDLSSRVGARVAQIFVNKGDRIEKGDLVLRLDCSEPLAQLAEANARLASAKAQATAAGAQVGAARRSQVALAAAGEAAKAHVAALDAQRQAAERQAARLESIPSDVPASSIDQMRASATGLAHQVEAAQAQVAASSAQAKAAAANANASGAQAAAAVAQVRAVEAAVARAELLVAECELRSPLDAEVAELPFEPGELVAPGAVLARLVSPTELKATFYLPNAEIGLVKPGARARVVADAWPHESFDAKVLTVGLEAEFTPRNVQTRSDRDRLVYPVEVAIDNPGRKLRSGMPVQVSLVGTGQR
jgi:HlyD family secretion protein